MAEIPNAPKIEQFLREAPAMAVDARHPFIRCDNCNCEEIVGICFSCLHCPVYNLCQKCERQGTTHPQTHIFQLLRTENDTGL